MELLNPRQIEVFFNLFIELVIVIIDEQIKVQMIKYFMKTVWLLKIEEAPPQNK